MKKQLIVYKTQTGNIPYREYLESLRDRDAASRIRIRVTRAHMGNLGDHRSVGYGVIELRIDFGPGHRVYVALHGDEFIILLSAGDKSTQQRDISNAHGYWRNFKENL